MIRKLDYILFFALLFTSFLGYSILRDALQLNILLGQLVFSIFMTLILGTITNFIFQSKNNTKL